MKKYITFVFFALSLLSCGNAVKPTSGSQQYEHESDYQSAPTVTNPAPRASDDDWTPTISEQSQKEDARIQQERELINRRADAYHSGVNAGVIAGKNDALQGNPMNTSFIQKYGSDEDGLTTKWNEGFVDGYTYAYDGFKNDPNFNLFTYDGNYIIR